MLTPVLALPSVYRWSSNFVFKENTLGPWKKDSSRYGNHYEA